MEKKRSDRKANKEAEKSKHETKRPILIVTDPVSLAATATQTESFKFDPSYTALNLPHSSFTKIIPIMDALNGDTAVKHLTIQNRIWDQQDLKSFLVCLSTLNMGITKITLEGSTFEPTFIEVFTRILKLNPRIKTLEITNNAMTRLSTAGFDRFCDSMEYYQFEELSLMNSALGEKHNTLFESLKYNQSIKTLRLTGEYMKGTPFITLCQTLVANPTITDLQLSAGSFGRRGFDTLKEVLQVNYIKKLTIENQTIELESLKKLEKEFKSNTSITECNFRYVTTNFKLLMTMLANHKSITKLDISGNNFESSDQLNLPSNTTWKDLTMTNCWGITDNYRQFFLDLMDNNTLQRLVVGNNGGNDLDANLVEQFLTRNKSLTEFSSPADNHKEDVVKAIANGLLVNRTLRKLGLKLYGLKYDNFEYFINALKVNTTLLEIETNKMKEIFIASRPPKGNQVEDFVLDLLQTNKTLRYFSGSEAFDHVHQKLKEHRQRQDTIISDTRTVVNMIALRPNLFILPVEVWLMVLKFVSYDFVSIDFEQYFKSLIQ